MDIRDTKFDRPMDVLRMSMQHNCAIRANAEELYSEIQPALRCGYHVVPRKIWGHTDFLRAKDLSTAAEKDLSPLQLVTLIVKEFLNIISTFGNMLKILKLFINCNKPFEVLAEKDRSTSVSDFENCAKWTHSSAEVSSTSV
ncbi:unnamed protein product [Phaedon cochleariae]|uniref:Uncharacterized protein n=1 Tax=Phaedon cochleariae TaxID=80249 RepID=A0A9N9S8N9_PHACE|nr:unnamed protein product [Phaedon cochleariae]